jgi:hypothetical protein
MGETMKLNESELHQLHILLLRYGLDNEIEGCAYVVKRIDELAAFVLQDALASAIVENDDLQPVDGEL